MIAQLKEKLPAVGVLADRSNLKAALVNSSGELEKLLESPIEKDIPFIESLDNFANRISIEFGKQYPIGISISGLIDPIENRIVFSTRYPELVSNDLASVFAKYGLNCILENDANASAIAEYIFGAAQNTSSLFYATIGEGVGGAFILNGELWRGRHGFAGEFGFVAVDNDGLRLEEVASADNIVRRTISRLNRDSTTVLGRFNEEEITIGDILEAAREQDDFALLMIERTGTYVGTAVANVINLLNIEKVVISGDITTVGDVFIEAVKSRTKELAFGPAFELAEITKAQLGHEAKLIGAALASLRTSG